MMKTTKARKAGKGRRKASKASAAHFLQDNAGMALRRGRETLSRAYDWAHEAGNTGLGALRLPRRSDIGQLSEANPLLLGAVGLGLGVAIGTLFPRGIGRRRPAASTRAGNGSSPPAKSTRRRRKKARGGTRSPSVQAASA